MTTKVIMPQMGESVFEGTLTKWLKSIGSAVVRDEPLFEISTDKVDSEIPAPISGILSEILVPEGATIQINTVVAIISEENSEDEIPKSMNSSETIGSTQGRREEIPAKDISLTPPKKDFFADTLLEEGPTIRPLDVRTSPLVRKIARENNADLEKVVGTGLEGRITKEDLLNYLSQHSSLQIGSSTSRAEHKQPRSEQQDGLRPALTSPEQIASVSEFPSFIGETEAVPMTAMRKAIAEHMVLSKRVSAHVNTIFEVDVSSIVHLRETHKVDFNKREGISLTYSPFFAKALMDAVRDFPILNSSVSGETIVYKKSIHLGIAVALDLGLIVPVIRDAHLKNFTGLALAIQDLAERARTKRLKPSDVQNGTISITNPGVFGSLFGTPIISQPQVAILGIGAITKRPVVIHDGIAIRSMVFLSLTFDHRVIDGAVADQFMSNLKERLQTWTQWID
jgi:pyruvate dehydrogenase E2 component (dihydrolipoamide acetyltransferase)